MDANTQQVLTIISLIVSVGSTILGIINHKKIRSTCCRKEAILSFDLDDTRETFISRPSQTSEVYQATVQINNIDKL